MPDDPRHYAPDLPPGARRPCTLEEYHRLIRAGELTEDDPVELLEGWIVDNLPRPRSPRHDATVERTAAVLRDLLPAGWHYRIKSGATMGDSEPEPDVAVVRDDPRSYFTRHPEPEDITLIVEVADESLARDQEVKARVYARAGIPAYWVANLNDGRLEVNTEPSGPRPMRAYRRRVLYGPGDYVPLHVNGRTIEHIPVRALLVT